MKQYNIYYNDGVFAETICFKRKSKRFIRLYFTNIINEYNKNPNESYHITFDNIKLGV